MTERVASRLRIAFVNMPFSSLGFPSFALSQLSALIAREFERCVEVDVVYANHEFARRIGVDRYETAFSDRYHHTGLGDWLFGSAAFPESAQTDDEYFARYAKEFSDQARQVTLEARDHIDDFLGDLIARHDLASADVVGCTSMFAQTTASLALARRLKELNPELITLLGGANCETPMGAALIENVSMLDYVFAGPALRTLPQLVRRILDGEHSSCSAIPGVVSRMNYSEPLYRSAIGADRPIADLIEPDFTPFLESFRTTFPDRARRPNLFFETSRGCWWGERAHCTFCGLNGTSMKHRALPSATALTQFRQLIDEHEDCELLFGVDNIMPVEYVQDVFPYLETPENMSIFYEIKVGKLDRNDLSTLASGGVRLVQPGIEALATSTLKLMRKGTSAFQNITFLMDCVRVGIVPLWNLLTGFPRESEETYARYEDLLPILTHLPPPLGVYQVRFDRYSPYFVDAEEYGLELQPFDYYPLTYPFTEASLDEFAYYFTDHGPADYHHAAVRWQRRLAPLVETWRARWDVDPLPDLRLEMHERGTGRVIDSRALTTDVHELDQASLELIRQLTTPKRLATVISSTERKRSLDWLRERRLVFEESGKVLGLVMIEPEDTDQPQPRRLEAIAAAA